MSDLQPGFYWLDPQHGSPHPVRLTENGAWLMMGASMGEPIQGDRLTPLNPLEQSEPDLVNLDQMSEMLGMSKGWLSGQVRDGKLPGLVDSPTRILMNPAAVRAALVELVRNGPQPAEAATDEAAGQALGEVG